MLVPVAARDLPAPDDGVLVRVRAAAVNPADLAVRAGAISVVGAPPWIPGMDFAGEVVEAGSRSAWTRGDRVFGMALPSSPPGGAYTQLLAASDVTLARVPTALDWAAASTLAMNGLTALQALDVLEVAEGTTLAVSGAAGVLGSWCIRFARERGARVIADSSAADRAFVASLGVDDIVSRDAFATEVRARVRSGVDALLDAATLAAGAEPAVRDGGRLASVRGWTGLSDARVTVFPLSVVREFGRVDRLEQIARIAQTQTAPIRVAGVLSATHAARAHHRMARGGVRGRLVLDMS